LRTRVLARALVRGRVTSAWEEALVFAGTVCGAAYGLRVGSSASSTES
jgi:hypothetical protein